MYNSSPVTLLLENLSFGDNLQPSQVSPKVRENMVRGELKGFLYLSALILVVGSILGAGIAFGHGLGDPKPSWTLQEAYLLEAGLVGLVLVLVGAKTFRRTQLIKTGAVTKGVVLVLDTPESKDPESGYHVRVYFRFVPSELRDLPGSDLLKEEVRHFERQEKIPADWGGFGSGLRPGKLISVLYDLNNPARCFVVPLKRSDVEAPQMDME